MGTNTVLLSLFKQLRERVESEENIRNRLLWDTRPATKEEGWMSTSALPSSGSKGNFWVFTGNSYWSRRLHLDLKEYFFNAETFLRANLEMAILHFDDYKDCSCVSKAINWSPGVATETALMGVKVSYPSDKDPWESKDPILDDPAKLEMLEYPDFYISPFMAYVHRMYSEICEMVDKYAPDFKVNFPSIFRSPFAVACTLRGMENLLIDMYDNPDFVHRLMSYVTETRIRWEKERAVFLGQKIPAMKIGNDEVNCPTISPALYKEFILPYETKLLKFYGKLDYFHSCGNITPLLESIKTLSPTLLHISSWTDLRKAAEIFSGTSTRFEVWVHPAEDVMMASREHALEKISCIARTCSEYKVPGYSIVSGNIQAMDSFEKDDFQIKQWVEVCHKVIKDNFK